MRSILTRGNIPNMTQYLVGPPSALMTAATQQPQSRSPAPSCEGRVWQQRCCCPFQLPEAMEAFLQSLKVLVGMLSSLETWIGLTPGFRRVRAATLVELLLCSVLRFGIVMRIVAN